MTTVCLLLFHGCDVMAVVGPYEVLLTANRLVERDGGTAPFMVTTVSLDGSAVDGYGGLGLVPSGGRLDAHQDIDVLVVPGLIDVDAGLADETLVAGIADAAASASVTASVCTGAFLLEEAGVTTGLDVTTHWEDVPELQRRRAAAGVTGDVHADVRWVDSGNVVTAGGISAGIDGALHLVARLVDRDLAEATARQIDHRWRQEAA